MWELLKEVHYSSLEVVSLALEIVWAELLSLVALIRLEELVSLVALSRVVEPYVVRLSAISCLLLLVCSLTCIHFSYQLQPGLKEWLQQSEMMHLGKICLAAALQDISHHCLFVVRFLVTKTLLLISPVHLTFSTALHTLVEDISRQCRNQQI